MRIEKLNEHSSIKKEIIKYFDGMEWIIEDTYNMKKYTTTIKREAEKQYSILLSEVAPTKKLKDIENLDIKLLKNGIKINGKYFRAYYSSASGSYKGCASINLLDYVTLPKEVYEYFTVKNDTEIMIDYFEKDTIEVFPSHEMYEAVEKKCAEVQADRKAKHEKKMLKLYGKVA